MWPPSTPSNNAVLGLNSTRPSHRHRRRRRLRFELQLERLEDRQLLSVSGSTSVVPTASFIKQDTTTQGNWIGTYGSQGNDVIGNAASLPSYATVTPAGQASCTWAASSTDPRALQNAGGTGRIAACWYAPSSFTVDVNLTDGQTHDLELYFLDWDSTTRGETVQISNASTGAVLNTETVTSFHSGVYLDWAVSGNVDITFTRLAGANAVLSGLFFDPPPSAVPTASFIKQDTTTQGNWIGTYGSQGYDVIGNAASLPSYATVTPAGQASCTWAASSPDPRALQNASGSGRIAACWYSPSSFTVDVNLTDGQTHDLELYFVDWDTTARGETVQISNASTGAVLNTETVTSFHSGVYLDWAVSGNVDITFTRLAGANAVLSGLFLNPPATAAPTVGVESPASAATNVAVSSSVSATFSEAVQASTVGFTLKTSSGTAVAATVAYNSSTNVATLTPSAALAYGTTYTATITGAENSAGVAMSSPVSWSFTTDAVQPAVASETPLSGATGVAVSSPLTATFNEAVQSSTISFTLTNSAGTAVPATLTYNSSTDTATLTPSSALAYGTTYAATVSGAKDTDGDPMAAPVSWSFTTDKVQPAVASYTPLSSATGVAVSSPLTATFNEAVQSSTISFTLTNSAGTAVPATLTYNSSTDTATLTPSSPLANGTTYTANVSGAKDTAGDPVAGSVTWSFTTAVSTPTALTVSAGSNITTNAGSTVTFAGSVSGGTAPYTYSWNFGDGTTSTGNSASFVQTDTTTQGNWTGVYGAVGYNVIGSTSSYPSYATVTPSGQSSFTWASTTSDVRGLLIPGSTTSRIAACWYNPSFTIELNLTDGQVHPVSLYAVDWDTTSRSEQIQVVDGSSGAVLNTQTISSFHGGEYLTWNVTGNVEFKVMALAGANAVVSGLFIGTGSTAGSSTVTPSHVYANPGTYAATLTATDSAGHSGSSSTTVTVNSAPVVNGAPVVNAGSPVTVNAESSLTFGQATETGGTAPFTYTWNFGDGTTQTGSLNPSHTYANPGSYTATVTVTDANKLTSSSSLVVTVNDVAPAVTFTDPAAVAGSPVSFTASATDVSPADQAAGFTYAWNFGDGSTGSGATASHTFATAGAYTVTVTATDEYGKVGTASETITISATAGSLDVSAGSNITTKIGSTVTFAGSVSGGTAPYSYLWNFGDGTTSAGNTASFVNTDTTTQGNWTGVYGAAGYDVIGATSSLPSYATVTPSGQSLCTWAATTTDLRGLQTSPGSTNRIAAAWYNISFTIDVNLADGQVHPVSLYALDWDSAGRSEQIQVVDGTSGAVLNTQTISNFSGGEYLTWDVSGNVEFKVTDLVAPNAVISGLFIGAGSPIAGNSILNPSHVYANPGTYTATLTATDSAGHSGSSSTTVTVIDVAPTVAQNQEAPEPNATGVALSSVVAATFSKAVQPSTISFVLENSSGTVVPATVSYNSSSYVETLTPDAPLAFSTTYTALLSGAQDLAGTSMSPVSWSFTTTPHLPVPTVSAVSPASGATGIAVPNAVLLMSLSATFNEPVQPSTIALTWVDSSDNPISFTMNYSDATNTITAWPQVLLVNSTTYTVTVSGAMDAAGDTMSPFTWSFTTASATAATLPTVTSVSPSFNGSSVDVATPIAVNFNEAVLASSISSSNFTLVSAAGNAVPATISYSDIGTLHTATLTPTAELAYSTTYTATISGVTDSTGNAMAGPYTWSFVTASGSQTNTQLPLLYQSNLQYVGAFRVPYAGTDDANSFAWNGNGVAYNPANNSLFLSGFQWDNTIGEIAIPSSIVNSTNISNLATATVLQAPFSVWPQGGTSLIPNVSNLIPGDSSGVCIGGLQVVNGQLIGTLYDYYDTTGATVDTTFRFDSLNLSTATIEGMFQVGTQGLNAGFYDGYMCAIPAAWQSALGAPYLTGQTDLSILSRTSSGPAAFGFDPTTLSTSTPSTTIPYVYYPIANPLGGGGYACTSPLYNGNDSIQGVCFAPGSRSVLFFGSVGTNTYTYGTGSAANDTTIRGGGKGPHSVNGDYAYQVWAYNADDFLAVEDGQMQPWQLQPYATWNLDFPQSNPADELGGVTFDPSTNRLYVVEDGADPASGHYVPVIQVYQLTLSPPPAGTNSISLQPVNASPSVASGIGSNVGANLNASITPLAATQANPSAGSEIQVASSSSRSISIRKRRPAQESVMPRTSTILGLGMRKSRVIHSGNKHTLSSMEKFGLENNG